MTVVSWKPWWKFSWNLEEALRIKFYGLWCDITLLLVRNVKFELSTRCKFWFWRGTCSQTLDSGYTRLEERWSASVWSLVWEAATSTKHEFRWCSHTWMRGIGPVFWSCLCLVHFSVHFLHHHTRDSLRIGIIRIKGTVNRAQVAKKSYKKRRRSER